MGRKEHEFRRKLLSDSEPNLTVILPDAAPKTSDVLIESKHYRKFLPADRRTRGPTMPELRQNYFTKEWVIIATERAKRPEELATHRPAKIVPRS